eukprot:scaffold450765_cov20-Prasinocladus_malaysianus.AAC.1
MEIHNTHRFFKLGILLDFVGALVEVEVGEGLLVPDGSYLARRRGCQAALPWRPGPKRPRPHDGCVGEIGSLLAGLGGGQG